MTTMTVTGTGIMGATDGSGVNRRDGELRCWSLGFSTVFVFTKGAGCGAGYSRGAAWGDCDNDDVEPTRPA
jgi:hypothetical protein